MQLAPAQLDTLYEDALGDRLFEMPQPAYIGTQWAGGEHWGGWLTARSGAMSNALRWDAWTMNVRWSDDHKRLNAYVSELVRMVKSLPEYRALPRPKGNYID
jgi:hypothetical protein